ncbi:MAG: GDYXXLXY domain-containing protein [Halothece sp. Uz-M2-17]|nr:GDYXXLXY domain-containing protein [Halothece sp. Uz-M2-17]
MNKRSLTRFLLPLGFQLALICAMPAQAIYTHLTGETVILQTAPVDPYDLLRGYSQTLRYEISPLQAVQALPGWETVVRQTHRLDETLPPNGTTVYVILQAPNTENKTSPPTPWRAIAIRHQPPVDLADNQVAIQGQLNNNWVDYGLEQYYFPEAQREKINDKINQLQNNRNDERPFVVEVKVDEGGNAIPISLWLGNENYRF